jgi:hypothetical protein
MTTEKDQIPGLVDAVKRFFKVATAMNPKGGISLRFFENSAVEKLGNLTTEKEVVQALSAVQFNTKRRGSEPLNAKILNPLLEKARENRLTEPTVVITITDGRRKSTSESIPDCTRNAYTFALQASQDEIKNLIKYKAKFKESLNSFGYPGPAVVFLFCRVGRAKEADAFLTALKSDKRISDIVCCYKEDLAAKMIQDGSGRYTGEVSTEKTPSINQFMKSI